MKFIHNFLLLKPSWNFGAVATPVHRQMLLTRENMVAATTVAVVQTMVTLEDMVTSVAPTYPTINTKATV